MASVELKQFIPSHICIKCDVCCRFTEMDSDWTPKLTKEELLCLVEEGYPPSIFKKNQSIRAVLFKDVYICSLLAHAEHKCTIYKHRPFECSLYPFILEKDNGKLMLSVDTQCPFIKDKLEFVEFKKHVEYLYKTLSSQACRSLIADNPQLIDAYRGSVIALCELS